MFSLIYTQSKQILAHFSKIFQFVAWGGVSEVESSALRRNAAGRNHQPHSTMRSPDYSPPATKASGASRSRCTMYALQIRLALSCPEQPGARETLGLGAKLSPLQLPRMGNPNVPNLPDLVVGQPLSYLGCAKCSKLQCLKSPAPLPSFIYKKLWLSPSTHTCINFYFSNCIHFLFVTHISLPSFLLLLV